MSGLQLEATLSDLRCIELLVSTRQRRSNLAFKAVDLQATFE